jgi:hypothetical protein
MQKAVFKYTIKYSILFIILIGLEVLLVLVFESLFNRTQKLTESSFNILRVGKELISLLTGIVFALVLVYDPRRNRFSYSWFGLIAIFSKSFGPVLLILSLLHKNTKNEF